MNETERNMSSEEKIIYLTALVDGIIEKEKKWLISAEENKDFIKISHCTGALTVLESIMEVLK